MCTRRKAKRLVKVEVKGTTADCAQAVLTRKEVISTERVFDNALAVVRNTTDPQR